MTQEQVAIRCWFVPRTTNRARLELGDALIAACAFSNSLDLWTLNKKHYPMKDIRFFNPFIRNAE